jgi:tetraacyldisaccharide-1-P 4'-kinase
LMFPDHHAFADASAITGPILEAAKKRGATAVVTTDKDWVKWKPLLGPAALPVEIYRPVLRIRFLDGGEAIDALLRKALLSHS